MKKLFILLLPFIILSSCSIGKHNSSDKIIGTETNQNELKYQSFNVIDYKSLLITNSVSGNTVLSFNFYTDQPLLSYYDRCNIACHIKFDLYLYDTFFTLYEKYYVDETNTNEKTTIYDRNGYNFQLSK